LSPRHVARMHSVARRRVVRSLNTVAARLPKVVEPPRTMATHCEWAAGLRCTVAVLQPSCPRVSLAFNALPAARLAGARRRPCRVAP
jgi:hypothetical protein